MMHSALVYDIEIAKAIPPKDAALREPDVDYCAGWEDHANMGIACIGAYDYAEDRYRVFCADDIAGFAALVDARDLIVGFNHLRFDNAVLQSHGVDFSSARHYDLLREAWQAAGLDPDGPFSQHHGGFGLDAMAKANFGVGKTGHGAEAPVDWQRRRVGRVIDYCLADVWLTKRLFDRVCQTGCLVNPNGGLLPMRFPA
jgi:hypothetical protein